MKPQDKMKVHEILTTENPKNGKNYGNLRFRNRFTIFQVYNVLTTSTAYTREIHIYFQATALVILFTLADGTSNKETRTKKP